jgi:hypothetical protein
MHSEFSRLVKEYDDVFDRNISGYNGAAGPFEAVVNMGPVQPPQRKGRTPICAEQAGRASTQI